MTQFFGLSHAFDSIVCLYELKAFVLMSRFSFLVCLFIFALKCVSVNGLMFSAMPQLVKQLCKTPWLHIVCWI